MVFLVGMPGAGKTYWGQQISDHYNFPFIDLDIEIEKHVETAIADIFAVKGENAFRLIEHNMLKQTISVSPHNTIIACGGGTPVYHNNISVMKAAGCIVYIKRDINAIFYNLNNDTKQRPLLAGDGMRQKLEELQISRTKYYEQADYIITEEKLSMLTFAEIISSCTSQA